MKSVLISIQPKWVEKIASGKKTIEVRKSKPKLETPFKCYIYETKGKQVEHCDGCDVTYYGRGKVIGEFVCDKIYKFAGRWFGDYTRPFGTEAMILRESCLTLDELTNYLSLKDGYGWHISDLKIYDKPKELSEFYTFESNIKCEHQKNYYIYPFCEKTNKDKLCRDIKDCPRKRKQLTRPPQSWCYVESLGE